MAVNASRSMAAELAAGVTDGRYMQLAPNWNTEAIEDGVEQTDRLDWPTYARVERRQAKDSWLVNGPDRQQVLDSYHRSQSDFRAAPGTGRQTHVHPDAYKFGKDQKGA